VHPSDWVPFGNYVTPNPYGVPFFIHYIEAKYGSSILEKVHQGNCRHTEEFQAPANIQREGNQCLMSQFSFVFGLR